MVGYCSEKIEKSMNLYIDNLERTFCQTQGCRLNMSMSIFSTLKDTVIIIHAPLGCGSANTSFASRTKNFQKLRDKAAKEPIWISTNLDEVDSISGGEQKLEEAIIYAKDQFDPECIVVLNSCVPALIGDDIEGVISQLQETLDVKIIPIHCEGFKPRKMEKPFDAIYKGILNNALNDDVEIGKTGDQAKFKVNLLNASHMSTGDEQELVRLLEGIGLEVNVFPCYSNPSDFDSIFDSAINISVSNSDDYFLKYIKARYDMPYILKNMPIGIEDTNRWIRDIAESFNLQEGAEKFIAEENRELNQALEPFKDSLAGKTVLLTGGGTRTFAITSLLNYLGMKILDINGDQYDLFDSESIEDLINNKENKIFDIMNVQTFERVNIIERLKPDICIGKMGGNKQGIASLAVFGQDNMSMGYSGVFEIARRLNRTLKNTSFNKRIKENSVLPYSKEWYETDPFSYRDQSGSSGSI